MKISSLKISTHIVTIMNIIHPLDQHKYNKSYMMIISLGIFILFDNEEIMKQHRNQIAKKQHLSTF